MVVANASISIRVQHSDCGACGDGVGSGSSSCGRWCAPAFARMHSAADRSSHVNPVSEQDPTHLPPPQLEQLPQPSTARPRLGQTGPRLHNSAYIHKHKGLAALHQVLDPHSCPFQPSRRTCDLPYTCPTRLLGLAHTPPARSSRQLLSLPALFPAAAPLFSSSAQATKARNGLLRIGDRRGRLALAARR